MISRTEDPVEVGAMLERIGSPDDVKTEHFKIDHWHPYLWGGDWQTYVDGCGEGWHAWTWGGGAFVVTPLAPGFSEVHVYVYPSARGVHAIRAAAEVARAEREAGVTLIGRTPLNNLPARRFASLCGGVVVGVEDDEEVRVWAN